MEIAPHKEGISITVPTSTAEQLGFNLCILPNRTLPDPDRTLPDTDRTLPDPERALPDKHRQAESGVNSTSFTTSPSIVLRQEESGRLRAWGTPELHPHPRGAPELHPHPRGAPELHPHPRGAPEMHPHPRGASELHPQGGLLAPSSSVPMSFFKLPEITCTDSHSAGTSKLPLSSSGPSATADASGSIGGREGVRGHSPSQHSPSQQKKQVNQVGPRGGNTEGPLQGGPAGRWGLKGESEGLSPWEAMEATRDSLSGLLHLLAAAHEIIDWFPHIVFGTVSLPSHKVMHMWGPRPCGTERGREASISGPRSTTPPIASSM
eukprot:jgi/Botrbrau1/15249/Bobra.0228s0002.1